MSCFAAMADAVMRVKAPPPLPAGPLPKPPLPEQASDIPSWLSAHYSGEAPGPVRPYGFDMWNFEKLSQTLRFSTPPLP